MMPGVSGILEAALYASDIDAAEAFYGNVLGLERVQRKGTRHVFFRVGESVLLIFNPEETMEPAHNAALPVPCHGARGPGHVCLAASAARIAHWCERLREKGVAIEADFLWPNGARSLYFRDPAGNSVEIAESRLWM